MFRVDAGRGRMPLSRVVARPIAVMERAPLTSRAEQRATASKQKINYTRHKRSHCIMHTTHHGSVALEETCEEACDESLLEREGLAFPSLPSPPQTHHAYPSTTSHEGWFGTRFIKSSPPLKAPARSRLDLAEPDTCGDSVITASVILLKY